MTPAATCARNSSTVMPAPIFFCSGRRRLLASTVRRHLTWSMRCETDDRVIASLSITKPGFTPVPTSATPHVFASSSSFFERSGYFLNGYESSSQVETTHDSAARHSINWSITDGSDEEVEWITTSADLPSIAAASATTGTPHGASGAPTTS